MDENEEPGETRGTGNGCLNISKTQIIFPKCNELDVRQWESPNLKPREPMYTIKAQSNDTTTSSMAGEQSSENEVCTEVTEYDVRTSPSEKLPFQK
jgi:hypothetical protein